MATKQFPEWAKTLYRGVRAAIAAGITQALVLQPDLTDLHQAAKLLAVAFLSGFLVCFGKWLRDKLDEWFGMDEKSTIQKVMPI